MAMRTKLDGITSCAQIEMHGRRRYNSEQLNSTGYGYMLLRVALGALAAAAPPPRRALAQ